MNYDITVLYAYRTPEPVKLQELERQTIPSDRAEIIPVREDDIYHPHSRCLEKIAGARGRYTILLDDGDVIAPSFLEQLLEAASASKAVLFMPSAKRNWPDRNPDLFSLTPKQDLDIDSGSNPCIFPTELHGLLIRTEPLVRASGCVRFPCEEEKQILLHLLGAHPVFHYLGSCSLHYVQPREQDWGYDIRCQSRDWYYAPFEHFLIPYLDSLPPGERSGCLAQHLALSMVNNRFNANLDNRNRHVIPPDQVLAYGEFLGRTLSRIDTAVLLHPEKESPVSAATPQEMLLYLRLKKKDLSYYPEFSCTDSSVALVSDGLRFGGLEQLPLRLVQMDYDHGKLEIDAEYDDFFAPDSASVFARFGQEEFSLSYNGRYSRTKCFGVTFAKRKTFHVTIPAAPSDRERTLCFFLRVQGRDYRMEYAFPSHGSRFAKDFGAAYWKFGRSLSYWDRAGIHVVRSTPLRIWKRELLLWAQMWRHKGGMYREQVPEKIINFLLQPWFSRQKIWLFLDKIYKGADSSEYMYRYASKKKDGIRKYYLLDKSSADYVRMKKEGYRPLIRGTLKHHLIFLNADMVIASNSTVFAFNDYGFVRSLPIRGDVHFDVACVQHGMSVQKIAIAQQRLRDNTRLYFCASKYEIQNLSKPEYDYVGYDALKLTGVPRYDGLKNRARKILVISPTWRMQSALPSSGSEGISRNYNPNFKKTDYYRIYNGLINDPRLLQAARRHGYRIQYVLHPIVSPQHEDFTKNDVVEIIPSIGNMSYETIFCEGALMVTDYSGVQFDFAYMRKPVVYLHHRDVPQHYEEGTFFYETMGFGEICHTNEELIDVLCRYMEHGCQMPDYYRRRADDFFAFSDNRNCERIYPILLAHERGRDKS